ncbi:hypothetical protein SDRG_08947 [Saprolegnia diclina VS20]|uniref:Uncharacterized protein n=1 Tax=Saprolegnia diclina (strain VS20) TaxID=1156394 RepID=T0RT41_SAPDV|nr:hypothetical protein SDRG_08947 [Saprolegnia diclina VS20]EQC33432.1 hypothetical protein SDRG_08947 [Saprolegnia diclina VS20]|eukprot:XP_008613072.1 hypothetical protein SDRG_08947 [Saprolegnia diclina VS20]
MWSTAAFVGNATLSYLNGTRGAGDTWYANSLANFLVFLCVEMHDASDLDRCVPSTSAYAAKNASSGICLALHDEGNCFAQNLCERRESCKWPLLTDEISVRVPLFTDADAVVATQWVRKSYPKTLYLYTVPGLLVAAVLVLSTWTFCVMRFGCNRCWGATPSRHGYTWLERWGPIVVFLWTTCFLIACAAIALAQGVAFQDAAQSIAGSTNATMTQLATVRTDAFVPFEALQTALPNVSRSDVAMALAPAARPGNWTNVVASMESFTDAYRDAGEYPLYACSRSPDAHLVPTTTSCTACPEVVCGDINGSLQRILDDTAPIALTPPLTTLLEPSVNASSTLDLGRLRAPLDSIRSLAAAYYTSTYPRLLHGFDVLESLSVRALQATLGLGLVSSALGLVGIFAGLVSGSSRLVHLLHGSWMTGVVFSFLGLVLGTYCLVLAVVGLDLCTYFSLMKSEPNRYLPSAGATIVAQCLGERTYETAFPELRPLAQWTCEGHAILESFALINLSQPLEAAEAYSARLQSFRPSTTFGYTMSELLRRIAALAVATTKATWTPTRLLSPWQVYGSALDPTPCTQLQPPDVSPLCFMALQCHGTNTTCYTSFERAYSLKRLDVDATALLASMTSTYVSGPKALYAAYATTTASSRTAYVHAIATNSSLGASLAAGQALACAPSLRCATFQAQAATLEAGLCHSTLEFLALCSALLFAATVCHLAQVLAAILLQKRLRGQDLHEMARRKQQAAVATCTDTCSTIRKQ